MISLRKIVGTMLVGTMLAFGANSINAADSKKPIIIPIHNWSSQVVMSYVIGGIFTVSYTHLTLPTICSV